MPSGWQHALEGPYGDHTGYYNECAEFPVLTVDRITLRQDAIYHSTYTGKPPDEPAVLGLAMNELFIRSAAEAVPEIVDFYLPPEGCSYRLAVVSIRKAYAGHARRVMMGVWSHLRQFMYTKFIVVVDDDVDVRDWKEVIWAITTRMDPARDTLLVEHTPIDYLDFASPVSAAWAARWAWTPRTNGRGRRSGSGGGRWPWTPPCRRAWTGFSLRWACDTSVHQRRCCAPQSRRRQARPALFATMCPPQ